MSNANQSTASVATSGADKLTDRKRADILDAAIACFSENGFDNTSMDAIASHANVSKRTVYNHFSSKDTLFMAIVNKLKENATLAVPLVYSSSELLGPQLTRFCHGVIDFHCQNESRALARILISRFIRAPQLGHEMFGNGKIFETGLSQWIVAAQKDMRLASFDIKLGSKQLIAMLEGFCVWPQLMLNAPNPDKAERDKIVNSIITMFLNTYGISTNS
ncbi:MAG: TetR/AcrR family transcriptional regulator [Pirellula sp.]|jgi:TetR/AcrR family transcriptional regulator of autoinduction and epiphytic fitness|nr:TetR/AcrR family transcriptional regulator [Pirellula sp.]